MRFEKGNKYGKGRPAKSKNQIEQIRSRILRVVKRRIFHEKDLETVSTPELLKFLASVMPKDLGIALRVPQINYYSSVPRELPPPETPQLSADIPQLDNPIPQIIVSEQTDSELCSGEMHPAEPEL